MLMCPPAFLPALGGSRTWTIESQRIDVGVAQDQWVALRTLVDKNVGTVIELQPEPWGCAMTFTRDLGVTVDDQLVPLMAHSPRGPLEAPLARRTLLGAGYPLASTDAPIRLDGGNVVADSHGRLLIGVTTSTLADDFVAAVRSLEAVTGRPAFGVPIVGGRFPHVDMALCDLGGRAWLAYPDALAGFDLDDPAWRELFDGQTVILVNSSDGERLACNLIVHGDLVIGPQISSALQREIESTGMTYIATPLCELLKAGGGAHCLTLDLPT